MSRPESSGMHAATRFLASLLVCAGATAATAATAAEPKPYRHAATIEIVKPAPFVELALPVAAYAHAAQPDLRDLRVVDATGERVPFALRDPTPAAVPGERQREASLYPLPQRPAGSTTWPSPVEVTIDGDRISVRRSAAGTLAAAVPLRESPGWLIDLGERAPGDPAPQKLLLRWSGPMEFSAAYAIESSADLRDWRRARGGQVMSLQSAQGVLAQPVVVLPEAVGRFIRLSWLDPASAPVLSGAASVVETAGRVALADELVVAPSDAPPGKEPEPRGSLHFDLGGRLPVLDVELRFAAGTRVAPVRLQGRTRVEEPWRDLGSGVFYRIERDGQASTAPALPLAAEARFIRVVPDERAAALDPSQTRLVLHARLATLVFATSGQSPLRLLVGSADAPAGALPLATLVPQLEEERKRFGQARLGAFTEAREVAEAVERAATEARLRLGLLWAVLVIGVAGLGLLVWRLAKTGAASPPTPG